VIHLLRSTAFFAVRLLLSVAVVYRFFHAENKSIFAQRYGPHTLPDDTKHTNVRHAETKYKTIVKEAHYVLISCGFSALAPLAEMRYTGNAETNVKEKRSSNCESAFGAARRPRQTRNKIVIPLKMVRAKRRPF
jgi:cbb3-type cytochrome oxidase subunit 3